MAYFQPRRLGHVNLWASDLARSEKFYHEQCGLMVEFTEPELEATFLGVGITAHDLGLMRVTEGKNRYGRDGSLQLPGTIGLAPGLNHVAWELETGAELVAAFRRMKADGVLYDMTMDHQIAHSVYMFDPDGNYNEFYADTTPEWRAVLSGEMGLISGRWDPEVDEGSPLPRYPVDPEIRRNEAAAFKPLRLTHVTLETVRMAEMLDFYTRVAGLRVVKREGDAVYLKAALEDYAFSLVLVAAAAARYGHASFEVAALEGGATSVFVRDPDGLETEFYVQREAV